MTKLKKKKVLKKERSLLIPGEFDPINAPPLLRIMLKSAGMFMRRKHKPPKHVADGPD